MQQQNMLPELQQLQQLIDRAPDGLRTEILATIPHMDQHLPLYALSLGNPDPALPAVVLVGGVHGLERIGTQVVLAYLRTLLERLCWDNCLLHTLDHCCIYFIPLLNPAGMANGWRANGNCVDLMRNAPVDCVEGAAWLVGGQRLSRAIPWHRGRPEKMEAESQALVSFISRQLFQRPFSLVLDCHSGFGRTDRIWFPYAKSAQQPISHLAEMYRLRQLFMQSYPHQNYIFEPQSQHYLCHGDLWDYLYELALAQHTTMLPLTLEMGSWNWVRKNPFQLFSSLGMFHPVKPHRVKRVLRSHLVLINFLINASLSYQNWLPLINRQQLESAALKLWYQ
ncbi:M14 family zinc carboxypeptidase [Arsukibacterium sp.]|uniref:M14 family zinc carboxypeptidase n=1 Tax=Arsukibacterium sp. TaxID=1977258 RepID=UPI00299E44BE|nr:M14 family zinc carboxypeptidase [Arsukibacterium sp.]